MFAQVLHLMNDSGLDTPQKKLQATQMVLASPRQTHIPEETLRAAFKQSLETNRWPQDADLRAEMELMMRLAGIIHPNIL